MPSATSQPKKLPVSDGKVAVGGVCLSKNVGPEGRGGIRILTGVGRFEVRGLLSKGISFLLRKEYCCLS